MKQILFLGPPIYNGMAGSKRLKNLWEELAVDRDYKLISFSKLNRNTLHRGFTQKQEQFFIHSHTQLLRQLFSFANTDTIIYHYGYVNINTLPLILLSKVLRLKILIDIVEDLTVKTEFTSYFNKLKYKITKLIYKITPWLCDGIIVISSHLRSKISRDFKNIMIELIPISIHTSNFNNQTTRKAKEENTTIKLFYGGSFASKDGIEDILEAFNELRILNFKCRIILTGRIDKKRHDKVYELLSKHPYRDDITYLGFLSDQDYFSILNSCDIHIMCRTSSDFASTGFPFKLGEMLATGKPVIVTKLDEVTSILEDRVNCILVETENPKQIVRGVEFLLKHSDLAQKIGENGRKTALANFDSGIIKSKFIEFLRKIYFCNDLNKI